MAKIEWASGIRVSAMAAMGTPINSQGLRRPKRVQVWSLFKPAQGETKTLKILSQVMMKKGQAWAQPKAGDVRYLTAGCEQALLIFRIAGLQEKGERNC